MMTKKVNLAVVLSFAVGLVWLMGGCATQSEPVTAQGPGGTDQVVALGSITASETDDTTSVTITADGPLTFSSFKKPDPPAVVLIFPATSVDRLPSDPVLDSDLIREVKVSDGNGGRTARIEFQLATDAHYTATQQGSKVLLTFNRSAEEMDQQAAASPHSSPEPAGPVTAAAGSGTAATAGDLPSSTSARPAPDVPKTMAWLNKIDFLSESEGKSTLVLGTTHAVDYRINKINPQKIELRMLNTRVPSYRQRALITTRFNSAVDRVVPYQSAGQKNETRVSIEMRQSVPYYVEQTDNLLLVHFAASSVPPRPMEQAQLPTWKKTLAGDVEMQMGTQQAEFDVAQPEAIPAPPVDEDIYRDPRVEEDLALQAILEPRRKQYTGEKIALDFYETDIKNVFRILREVSGKNFAIDKDVTGKVTMSLDKPVPWDQVLDLVLRMNQLGKTMEGDILRIATLETLKAEDDLRKAKLEALRKSRDEAKALEPLVTKYIPVSYANADAEVKPHIEKILTPGRGTITIDKKNNQVILTDTEAKVGQAVDIVRRIDKVTSQVMIEAKIVEVNKDFARSLGIDWSATIGSTGTGFGNYGNTDWAMNFPVPATSSIGVQFSRLSGVPYVIDARISAVETTGDGQILSSPKILTLDNKKATIKQGLEYPYLERDSSGGSSVKFKDVDLALEVTPHVTPDNRISMAIKITKNDVDSLVGIEQVPALATNEAETELLVNDGDTVVIGGIIKKIESNNDAGWPGFKDIPLLGWIFKNQSKVRENNELLIFITPRIVQLEQDVSGIVATD